MQTPTHALLALALLSKKNDPARNRIVLLGALIPDVFIYICWVWLTAHGIPQERIWNEIYFESGVQFWSALSNSVPMYGVFALIGWGLYKKTDHKNVGLLLLVFSLAALTHMATDFPFHAEDAHQHFWPFTHWKFHSPLSYWDSNHYGAIIGFLESIMALACITVLWKRFSKIWVRILLGLLCAFYALSVIMRALFWTGILGS